VAHITFVVLPLASAAQSLTEEIRSILELHPQELRHSRLTQADLTGAT